MQSELVKAICQIGVFIICAQVIVHLRPERSYEKYIKMLVSAMILIQLLRPFCGLLGGAETADLAKRALQFEERLNEAMQRVATQNAQGEAVRQQMTLEEVRRRVEESREVKIEPVEKIVIDPLGGGENNAEIAESAGVFEEELEEMVPQR